MGLIHFNIKKIKIMKIFTSYFGNIREIKRQNLFPIAISIFHPPTYIGSSYKKLAPPIEFLQFSSDIYTEHFLNYLEYLSITETLQDLKKISNDNDIALLCYEKPENFCHRHLVAMWIMKNSALSVKELLTKKISNLQGSLFNI
jgi:hypothetical protein